MYFIQKYHNNTIENQIEASLPSLAAFVGFDNLFLSILNHKLDSII